MERRDFIKSIAAGLAATYLAPSVLAEVAPSPVIWNTETLTSAMQGLFWCHMGPATAFYEVNKKTGEIVQAPQESNVKVLGIEPVKPQTFQEPNAEEFDRYVYTTYACAIDGGDAKEAEARLAKHFYDHFSKLPKGFLIWRTKPHFETIEATKFGDTWATVEEVEDNIVDLNNKPKNVEFDFNDGKYKQVVEKVQVHKMRMRLVLPHLYADTQPLPHLVKPDGAKINRMV